jgi:cell fate regulator YaaT (PSP1 superfamily)
MSEYGLLTTDYWNTDGLMPNVVGIRFKDSGKIYYFDPNGHTQLTSGQHVIVETVRGPELAKVLVAPAEVAAEEIVGELKPVLRFAEPADFERLKALNARQTELLARCNEKIVEHNLPMHLVKAEYSFDGSRLTFYFTAEKRVDFRMLVRDLARLFRARIELRQIGPRDEAKLLGGIGPCGRLLCCATFLPDYARVSIKMAKDQDLPLNPTKISGVCGRLLCCLSYEHEQYLEIKAELPRKGMWVQTPDGPGEVIGVNVVKETVTVELAGSLVHEEFAPGQITDATDRVASLARSRTQEGITPAALADLEHDQPEERPSFGAQRRERRPPEPRRDKGERRLLRDEIENPEVLDALAMLEDGPEEDYPRRQNPEHSPPKRESSRASEQMPPQPQQQPDTSSRRPPPQRRPGQQRVQSPHPPNTPQSVSPPDSPERPAQPGEPSSEEEHRNAGPLRRRRRKG